MLLLCCLQYSHNQVVSNCPTELRSYSVCREHTGPHYKQLWRISNSFLTNFRRSPNDYFMEWRDFARYVADHGVDYRKNLDAHFHPITADCDPCRIPFNYIVKVETFNEGGGCN